MLTNRVHSFTSQSEAKALAQFIPKAKGGLFLVVTPQWIEREVSPVHVEGQSPLIFMPWLLYVLDR